MFIKFVCVLLMLAVAQAFPSSDVKLEKNEPTCPQKIEWYRDITNKTKIMYAEYHAKLKEADLSSDAFDKLAVENSNFENAIASVLRKIDARPDNSSSTNDEANKKTLCDNIDDYRMATLNLTRAAIALKSNVLNVIDHSELPNEAKDNFSKALAKIVNFLFEVDMTENAFKDLEALAKEAETKATQGIQLDKQYEVTKNGVEKITESAVSEPGDDVDVEKDLDDATSLHSETDLKIKHKEAELKESESLERERLAKSKQAEQEKRERDELNAKIIEYHYSKNGRTPIHLNPGRTVADAVSDAVNHPAVPLTIIGVILIVICGMFVWNWVRPDQWIRARYARMP